ncbi:YihY/virulence factor BrkB family protein [Streptococcus sp. X13SY08]|uniref:YihY/virulence factor BrkB family protein n=1 Tax=Streptococcus sp. X13SY08 TaxID=1676616 RepID=UPI001F190537|nr:YihY/virulence factor BrkB family protein [Streptococcus sp. X13SY08]
MSFYQSAETDITSVAVGYYLTVSIFPILMTMASLLPYLQFDVKQILDFIKDFIPVKLYPTAANIVTSVLSRPSPTWLGISIATTLWTISRSMNALQKAFNKAYGVEKHRDMIISYIVGFFLGVAIYALITLSAIMVAFGNTLLQSLINWLQLEDGFFRSLLNQTELAVYVTLFLGLVLLYFFLPNVRIRKMRFALPGAIFVMLVMGTVGQFFGLYVESYADKLLDFRFVTAVIILVFMLWSVFLANILIIGAVLNATIQHYFVDEFTHRRGDVISVFQRMKQIISKKEES